MLAGCWAGGPWEGDGGGDEDGILAEGREGDEDEEGW